MQQKWVTVYNYAHDKSIFQNIIQTIGVRDTDYSYTFCKKEVEP